MVGPRYKMFPLQQKQAHEEGLLLGTEYIKDYSVWFTELSLDAIPFPPTYFCCFFIAIAFSVVS